MRKIYLILILLIPAIYSNSQVSVTATIGTPGPTAYTSVKLAFDAVNAGTHKGVVSITLTGVSSETESAILNASGSGSASYTSLSIKPSGGVAAFITGDVAGPLIDLNDADNVTIDGLNADGNTLTISNANLGSGTNPCSIRFINDATNNQVKNCTILSSGTGAASGTIIFSTGTVTGNDNNTITNCEISDALDNGPLNAIYASGSVTVGMENNNITISNCNISDFFNPAQATCAIQVTAGNTDWTISNNRFFQSATRTFTGAFIHRIILITAGNNYSISGNTIGYATAAGTGIYTLAGAVSSRFIGIDLSVGTTTASNVQNNTITDFAFTTSNNATLFTGINIAAGNVNVGTVTGNTIGRNTGTGSITLTPTVGSNTATAILSSSTGTVTISNNNIGAMDLLPSGVNSGTLIGISTSGAGGIITISNNTIGNTTANNMKVGTLGTTTGSGIARGILNSNTGTILITSNTIRNLTHNSSSSVGLFRGIECQQGTATISLNNISNIAANGTSTSTSTQEGVGILITDATVGVIIDQNTVYNLSLLNTTAPGTVLSGIYLSGTNGVIVTRNRVYGFSNASTSVSVTAPGTVAGIYCRDANLANPMTIANNMISLGNAQTTNTAFIGIWSQLNTAQNYTAKIYYNSVNIEGTAASGSQPSFCYFRGDFTNSTGVPTVDIRNNIFTNSRSGGTGRHFAIANGYPNVAGNAAGWATNASDYNILNANGASVGYWGTDLGFAAWKTASASDEHSYNAVVVDYVNSASNLHMVTTANTAVDAKATPIVGFSTDYDNDTRNASTPDLGADEFTPGGVVPITIQYFKGNKQGQHNLLSWKAECSSALVTFVIERSNDGRKFSMAGTFSATQSRCMLPFDFTDNQPSGSINYYRLKMTEADGSVTYSGIIAIINKESGFEIVGLSPTLITRENAVLNVSAAVASKMEILVTDMSGKLVQKQTTSLTSGSNSVVVNMGNLSSGTYQLTGFTSEGKTKTIRFVKL